MPTYKLTYFNVRGRAEPARLMFALAGVEYEDIRIKGEDWAELKPTILTGSLPFLEVDGAKLFQSNAITRYVAAECKLAGSTNLEAAQCDAIIETIGEVNNIIVPIINEKDENKQAELKKNIFEEKIKPKLMILEKMLVGDVFVGKTITVADLIVFHLTQFIGPFFETDMEYCPKLLALKEKVAKEPKIAAWIAKRPVTSI